MGAAISRVIALVFSVAIAGPLGLPFAEGKEDGRETIGLSAPGFPAGPLFKEVLGFYPYWIAADEYTRMPLELLTTIAWFSVEAAPDGSVTNPHNWPPTALITAAHAKGVKVVPTMTCFTDTTTDAILADPAKQAKNADELLALVTSAGADGVNIDMEGVPKTNSVSGKLNRVHLVEYFQVLSQKFWAANPNHQISLDLPAVDWSDVWDVAAISNYSTFPMIMGYDYYWKGSANAGSVAPLDNGGGISVRRSVDYYLTKGVPKGKLLLGLPYYGYEWPTASDQRVAATQGQGVAKVYTLASANAAQHGRKWDAEWKTPWYAYQSGAQWYQGHYDDAESLGLKYDLILQQDIAGLGIWALGYDAGKNELWDKIREKFTDTTAPIVGFIAPANGSNVSAIVDVRVNASDDRSLASLALQLDGTQVAQWSSPPFAWSWNTSNSTNGPHQLTATATDISGNAASTMLDMLVWNEPPPPPPPNDTTPPKVSILAPVDGAKVGFDVAIVVDASDETGLAKVRLSIDGTQATEWNASPFRYVWRSSGLGNHRITAEAWDTSGNRAAFEISVEVTGPPDTSPPQVIGTIPEGGSVAIVGTRITVVFSMKMDPGATEASWSVSPTVAGTFIWKGAALEFDPSTELSFDTKYSVTIDRSAKSIVGTPMVASFTFEFRTDNAPPTGPSPAGGLFGAGGAMSPVPLAVGLLLGAVSVAAIAAILVRRMKTRHAARGRNPADALADPFAPLPPPR